MPSNLIPAMTDSIFGTFDPGIKDALIDVAEASLDCVLEDGFLKEVPILGTIDSMCKAGVNIRERNLLRQTSAFVEGMRDGSISPEKRAEHKKALEDNPRQAEKEIGRILLLLDCTIEERQSEYLASFYKSFVRGALSWDKFCELSEANSRMFMDDYSLLNEVCDRPISQDAEVPNGHAPIVEEA